jgi:chromosome segregation ATPase
MIAEMIEKLESDAASSASHKEYCDKETAESKAKQADATADIEKLTTKLDQMSSKSAELKQQVAALQKELAQLASSQAEMDKMRQEEKATFTHDSAETKEGLEGVKAALKVLRDYYAQDAAHGSAGGAATGIVGLLEVVESDFSKALAEMTSIEENSAATYEADSQENEIDKTMKTKDAEYKTAEAAGLDKAVTEVTGDRANIQSELDAVNEYLAKLDDMCVAKAEPYAEKKARRDAEIAGLKEALQILEGEAVLLQQKRRSLRGVSRHVSA